ncbi:MAG: hypothetical protein QM675_02705 [Protaetiibacter sp.]
MTEFTGAFPAPVWTPPAREPFLPLRPLTLGQILSGAFRALRHNPAVTLGPAIVVSLAATGGSVAFARLVVDPLLMTSGSSVGADALYAWLAAFGAGALGWVIERSLSIGAGVLQQGVSAIDVAHAVVGRRLTPGGFRRRTLGIRAPLVAWTAMVTLACAVLGGIGVALIGAVALADPGLGVLTGFTVGAGIAVLLGWLGTKLALVPSALVVERLRLGAGIARSWRLTRGGFWRIFGIRLLCWTMIWLAAMLVAVPVQLIAQWFTGILAGNGDIGDYLAVTAVGEVVAGVVAAVIGAIGLVVTTSTDAILYLDLRMRREGLDLELTRFMERRRPTTRFDPEEADPFRPPADIARSDIRPSATAPARGTAWG